MATSRDRFLPCSYLENFSEPDGVHLWRYRRDESVSNRVRIDHISSTGTKEAHDIGGCINKLIRDDTMSRTERDIIARFISEEWWRIYELRSYRPDIKQSGGQRQPASITTLRAMIAEMEWAVRKTEDSILVTSDSPVILNNPTLADNLISPTPRAYEVIFPLSARALFIATWDRHAGQGLMSAYVARQINNLICRTAEKTVYAAASIPAISKYLKQPKIDLVHPTFGRHQC